MKIKTKLQLIIIVNILILAGIVSLSLLWQKQAEDLIEQNAMITEVQKAIFERARLREEYFLHRTDRAKAQFLLIHKEIGGSLERMSKVFPDPEEKASLDGMIAAHLRIGHLFDRLIRLDEETGSRPAGTQALRERIISQMLVNAHVMYRDGLKLLKAANEKTANQNDLARLYGNITFGLLALLIGAFAVIIIRNITYPLKRLQEGTEMIARGNLDYKTDLRTRDEIGRLSQAFDAMTESLKKITASRDELNKEIEGRKRKEEELRAVSSYQESLLSAIPDIIMEVDGNKVYTWANQPGRDFFGKDVVGKEAAFYFEGDQDTYSIVQPLFNGHENVIYLESWQRRRDGEKRLLAWWCRVLKDENGQVTGALSSGRDITERKQAEEDLRKTEETYRLVVDNMADVITVMDLNLRFTYASPSVIRLLGYTAEEVMVQTLEQMMTPESLQIVAGVFEEELKLEASGMADPGRTRILELEEYKKDGSIVWLENRLSSLRDKEKKLVGIIALSHDITDRKRAEEALRENENKYRLLADNVNDVIFVLDMNLNYTYVSPSVKILRGYEPAEVLKQQSFEILTPSSRDLAMRTVSEIMELEKSEHREIPISRTLQLEMVRKDGTTVWTEVKLSFIRDENQRPVSILGVTRDITDRKRAEEELQQTLDSLRKAVGTTIQVMVSAVEARDPYTSGHQVRSADLARAIATEMGLPQEKIDGIRMAGSIHDIGKLSIPAEILSKPTKLTNIEFSLIQEHARQGFEILKGVESSWPLAEMVYQHHERMDGSGYPRNLKGEEILIEARILAVADVVEAMASHRPYRAGLGIDAALEEISKNRGILYDPEVTDACLKLFQEKRYSLN